MQYQTVSTCLQIPRFPKESTMFLSEHEVISQLFSWQHRLFHFLYIFLNKIITSNEKSLVLSPSQRREAPFPA